MPITVIRKPRVMRNYLVYDLEWIPGTLELRMVGVYDGNQYRCYRTIEAFLDGELTHKNRGKWFYAHAGGLADFQFVLEQLAKRNSFSVSGSTSGSSAIIVHVKRGKNSWHFIDSLWLMRDSLRNIGKWVGISKGNEDEDPEFYRSAPFPLLRSYNEQDCVILYKAIQYFEGVLWDLGGMLKMTQASCAMELFRRRFLRRDIQTSMHVNDIARNAYCASRVEVYSKQCENALYYDVNSSFPYAMTFPIPGDLREIHWNRLPPAEGGMYIADVTVEVPDCYLPPLPKRQGGRIFFPTGRWRSWYTSIDLGVLLKSGGKIIKVHGSMEFEPCFDLKAYAETLYELRRKSEGFPKLAYKYLLNSLYGKFAESEWKSGFVLNPPNPMALREQGYQMMFPGCFTYEKEVPIPHMHVPMSVHITSIARRTLYDYMCMSSKVHYCDTDGFSSVDEFRITGDELGNIKLEKYIEKGTFVQAKVYRLEGRDVKGNDLSACSKCKQRDCICKVHGDVPGVRAKGFSRMTVDKFHALNNFEEIEYVRMKRIKEQLRKGITVPEEVTIRKHLNREAVPKRFFYPDGESRPWSVKEIEGL